MVLFGLALTMLEAVALAVICILFVIGVTLDRRGTESTKWWIFLGTIVTVGAYTWSDFTFVGAWNFITSGAFLTNVAYFIVAGLLYSVLEFVLNIRRTARYYKDAWEKNIQSLAAEYAEVKEKGATSAKFKEVAENTSRFIDRHSTWDASQIVMIVRGEDRISVEPKINKAELAEHIGAWTLLWPFYAISLILGDLLTEVFNVIADFFVKLSGRFVRMSFADVFKF